MTKPKAISGHPPIELSNNAMILLDKIGVTNELIDEVINSVLPELSSKFHEKLIRRGILPGYDGSEQWIKEGFPSQIIEAGEGWKKGRVRLRVIAEFIPDDIKSENQSEKPIENSLDTFRES